MVDTRMRFWDEEEAKILFEEPRFYNFFIEKTHNERLNNINLLHELLFY